MKKKITSIFLALILLITGSLSATIAFAADKNYEDSEDKLITIDGVTYKFEDSYSNGEKVTHIINLTNNTQDTIYYDKEKETIFLNDEPIAYVEEITSAEDAILEYGIAPLADNYWVYHDTSTHRITWVQGVGAAIVAGAIAAVIPGAGALTVIAKIGLSALSIIAASSSGGTLQCVGYSHVLSIDKIQFRFDWTFIASTGDRYGPFSTYQL